MMNIRYKPASESWKISSDIKAKADDLITT